MRNVLAIIELWLFCTALREVAVGQSTNTVTTSIAQYEKQHTRFKAEVEDLVRGLNSRTNRESTFTASHYARLSQALNQAVDNDAGRQLLMNAQDFAKGKVGEVLFVRFLDRTLTEPQMIAPSPPNVTAHEVAHRPVVANVPTGTSLPLRNFKKLTIDEIRVSADRGDPEAQNALGDRYRLGSHEQANDYEKALTWYRKAADQGNAAAQVNLASMYLTGRGVVKNETEAGKWYRQAAGELRRTAELGDAAAQFSLGLMYANGRGIAKDETEAVKWYHKSADQGNAAP